MTEPVFDPAPYLAKGAQAFRDGKPRSANPYRIDYDKGAEWDNGWVKAQHKREKRWPTPEPFKLEEPLDNQNNSLTIKLPVPEPSGCGPSA